MRLRILSSDSFARLEVVLERNFHYATAGLVKRAAGGLLVGVGAALVAGGGEYKPA